jgi:hypothetical protein
MCTALYETTGKSTTRREPVHAVPVHAGQTQEQTDMAKKTAPATTTKKKTAPAADKPATTRGGWNQLYTFAQEPVVEPAKATIAGTVYGAIKRVKSGTLDKVHDKALELGLGEYTDQDTRVQTQVHLRRLQHVGVVDITRPGSDATPAKAKKATKVVEEPSEAPAQAKAPKKAKKAKADKPAKRKVTVKATTPAEDEVDDL